jgi:hypothetical protein
MQISSSAFKPALLSLMYQTLLAKTKLREWVKAGIKNDQVLNHLAATICRPDITVQPSFEQIFAHVRGFFSWKNQCQYQ